MNADLSSTLTIVAYLRQRQGIRTRTHTIGNVVVRETKELKKKEDAPRAPPYVVMREMGEHMEQRLQIWDLGSFCLE